MIKRTIHLFKRGAAIEGGRIAMGFAESFVPAKYNVGIPGTLLSVALAGAIGVAASKVVGGAMAEDIGVGAATRVIDRLIVTLIPGVAKKTGLAGYVPLSGYVGLSGPEVELQELPDLEPGIANYPAGPADTGQGMGWLPTTG